MDDIELCGVLNFEVCDATSAMSIQIVKGAELSHAPRCSSGLGRESDPDRRPGWLCDCGAVAREWQRLKTLHERLAEDTEYLLDTETCAGETAVDYVLGSRPTGFWGVD